MTIYTQVLDKSVVNTSMLPETLEPQTMYSLTIPASTLGSNGRLRIKALLVRTVGTPLPDSNLLCNPCHQTVIPEPQSLGEVDMYSPDQLVFGTGSFSRVKEVRREPEIFEAIYKVDEPVDAGTTFDENPNLKLYQINNGIFKQYKKVDTLTTDTLDHEARLIHGVADDDVYTMVTVTTISSNSPPGVYMYFIKKKQQIYLANQPTNTGSYDNFTILNKEVYLSESQGVGPSLRLYKFSSDGTFITSTNVIAAAGYSDIRAIHAFDKYIYALVNGDKILRINKNTFVIEGTWQVNVSSVRAIFAVSNDIIYFVYGELGVGVLSTGNAQTHVIDASIEPYTHHIVFTTGPVFPTRNHLHFLKIAGQPGFLYLSGNGTNKILKIGPIVC